MPGVLDIPMNIAPPPEGGFASGNPFGMLNQLTEFQLKLNQNRMFQQQFMANQAMGEIMANAPDLQTGLEAASKNPLVMGFGTQAFMNAKNAYLTGLQASGELGKQAQTGLEAAIKSGMTAGMQSPEMFLPAALASLETAPPAVRAQDTQALKHVAEAIQAKVGSVKPQQGEAPEAFANRQREAYKTAFVGLMGMGGVSPEQVNEMFPSYGIQNINGVEAPVKSYPGYMGKAPELVGGGGSPGMGAAPGPFRPMGVQGQQIGSDFQPITMSENRTAGDGTPLFHPDTRFDPGVQNPNAGMGGAHIFVPGIKESGANIEKDFDSEKAVRQFQAAQTANGMLTMVDQDIQNLAKRGGLMTPGPGGDFRGAVDSLIQTTKRITGMAPDISADQAIASWTNLGKLNKQLGMQLASTNFGVAREAAQTIQMAVSAVPGMENTPMGAMLMSAGIRAINQRTIDERDFMNEWRRQPYTQGNLTSAMEKFNAQHPAEGYVQSALDSVGMGTDHKFKGGPNQIMDLAKKGFFGPWDFEHNPEASQETVKVVEEMVKNQFPDFYKGLHK